MIHHLNENIIEQMTLVRFKNLGYAIAIGPDIAFDCPHPERKGRHANKEVNV